MYNYYLNLILDAKTLSQCDEIEFMINTCDYIDGDQWDDLLYAIDQRKEEIIEELGVNEATGGVLC